MDNISGTYTYNIYKDIGERTNGEIYIGVVGPVRTGKSTFIKRFMNLAVIPEIENEHVKRRTLDELPMSGSGSTITTTEPKFIPSEAPVVSVFDNMSVKIRMIDCVGFMVDGALGLYENDRERMVKTPWQQDDIPFTQAAELGTNKVIKDHSTIGIIVTTDGSFGEIDRDSYIAAEKRTVDELKKIGKPFVMLLNSMKPYSNETATLASRLAEEYGANVIPVNCDQLKKEDVDKILRSILLEFPVEKMEIFVPSWVEMLKPEHWLRQEITGIARNILAATTYIKDVVKDKKRTDYLETGDTAELKAVDGVMLDDTDLSTGVVKFSIALKTSIYYKVLSELTHTEINSEYELINLIREFAATKSEYDSVRDALWSVNSGGFGIVTPERKDIELEEPVVIKNGNKYGVRIKAKVSSINMLKTNILVEIAPIVGSKTQAEDLIDYIRENTKDNPDGIWDTNIFGKTVEQIVNDGIYEKTHNITDESMGKISSTLEKVMNENSGLVCLIV
jgi:stage IV sporulation protein A